jgi:hypothetical protein
MEVNLFQNRDVDFKILSELNDKDLFSVCLTNKYANNLCKDEIFWKNRFTSKIGNKTEIGKLLIKYKPTNRNWRNYYLSLISAGVNKEYLKNFTGTILIWKNANPKPVEIYPEIESSRVFIIEYDIRNKIRIDNGNYIDRCVICKEKLSNRCLYCLADNIPRLNIDFTQQIDISHDVLVNCPIERSDCRHIYHHHCINRWRIKRDLCPLDNRRWNAEIMDSFVVGKLQMFENEKELSELEKQRIQYEKVLSENPNYGSFEYFLYEMNPNPESSLMMRNEYQRRKDSYILSFHSQFPNSPSDPVYPPFNLFNYSDAQFPFAFEE